MPDDVGGKPFPDGWEPDDDRGGADQDFAAVEFDEDFVRAAVFHEPSAVERLIAAAQARAEADAVARSGLDPDTRDDALGSRPAGGDGHHADDTDEPDGPYGRHGGALRPYRGTARWHRPVAWLLALLMGVGMVVLAFAAVYRGAAAGNRDDRVPQPTRTGVDASPTGATVGGRGPAPVSPAPTPVRPYAT
ncbi:hypothetical protein ACRAR1_20335 [Streptomyces sanyensis]|uniref:SCO2584 family spore wall biosynthesis protein n=1 Tax=Streptomyces sanyensis TaxID=568869 RepID=UPI003D774192